MDEEKEGTLVENASRLEWDRSRLRRPSDLIDPEKADAEFMACLLDLLRKVSGRAHRGRLRLLAWFIYSDLLCKVGSALAFGALQRMHGNKIWS